MALPATLGVSGLTLSSPGPCQVLLLALSHLHTEAAQACTTGQFALHSAYAFQPESVYFGDQGSADGALDTASFYRVTGGMSSSLDSNTMYWTESSCVVRAYAINGTGSESASTIAGTPGTCAHNMGSGTFAKPTGIVVDHHDTGFAYVTDSGAGSIVKVNLADGSTTRVLGTGTNAATGTTIVADNPLSTQLKSPTGIFLRGRSLYTIALLSNGAYDAVLLKFNLATGVVSKVVEYETGLTPSQEGDFANLVDWDLFQVAAVDVLLVAT